MHCRHQKSNDSDEEDSIKRKKNAQGHLFGENHPLTERSYKGFVRTKFCTPVFGGKPIPACPKDEFNVFGVSEEEKANAD